MNKEDETQPLSLKARVAIANSQFKKEEGLRRYFGIHNLINDLWHELRKVYRELADASLRSGFISVSSGSLPAREVEVLVIRDLGDTRIGYLDDNGQWIVPMYDGEDYHDEWEVTHWTPLPTRDTCPSLFHSMLCEGGMSKCPVCKNVFSSRNEN